ncbi:hypothetical protein [Pseudomonas sp. BF-R-21]|uniref:hypothetical protein n=1 Tax=Pseudomonas sp. BF-R-21 TaxID=2832387 RepID=UPI001CBF2B0F|nr:hypothetical protein [Pseudomonas sp. BF-R-21]
MSNPLVKMREMQAAMRELETAMEALQTDPALRVELEFEADLQALLAKYGKTIHEAAKVVDPAFEVVVRKPGRTYNKRPTHDEHGNPLPNKGKKAGPHTKFFLFTNPHTNEVIKAANTLKKELQPWMQKYGKDEVLSWRTLAPTA